MIRLRAVVAQADRDEARSVAMGLDADRRHDAETAAVSAAENRRAKMGILYTRISQITLLISHFSFLI